MKRCIKYLLILPPLLICGAAVCLSHYGGASNRGALQISAATEEERLRWLTTHGLKAEMLASQGVVIPQDLSGNYADYAALQEANGLPLAEYAGESAVRITYAVEGSEPPLYAELLTADGILIGAQCYHPEEGIVLSMQGVPFTAPSDDSPSS